MSDEWSLFEGDGKIRRVEFPPEPPWRRLSAAADHRGETYQPTDPERLAVNLALHLRRPLLVEGPPGSGKSSLGYAVARELDLGRVLLWPINSRTTLKDGLYRYDAIGRMYALAPRVGGVPAATAPSSKPDDDRIGDFVTLGPLGTALLPGDRPRVLVIDEIDKSDIDLPNDLLHVLENGSYSIPELERVAKTRPTVTVLADPGEGEMGLPTADIIRGRVQATAFPFVVITSNGERELPPAFLRRCIRHTMADPSEQRLKDIVNAHMKAATADERVSLEISKFFDRIRAGDALAVDQLLNAVYLLIGQHRPPDADWNRIVDAVLKDLRAT
jgi:MoxR-like ATPase